MNIAGISRTCGALDLNIPDTDSEFCRNLKNNSADIGSGILPRVSEAECFEMEDNRRRKEELLRVGEKAFGSGLKTVPGGNEFENKTVMSW